MPKAWALCIMPNQILETEFWVKQKRIALLLSQAKEDASGSGHPNPGGSGEELYTNGSRMGMMIRLGCAQRLHSYNLASGGLSLE